MESFYVAPSDDDINCVFVDGSAARGERPPIILKGDKMLEDFLGEWKGEDSEIEVEDGKVEFVSLGEYVGVKNYDSGEEERNEGEGMGKAKVA